MIHLDVNDIVKIGYQHIIDFPQYFADDEYKDLYAIVLEVNDDSILVKHINPNYSKERVLKTFAGNDFIDIHCAISCTVEKVS